MQRFANFGFVLRAGDMTAEVHLFQLDYFLELLNFAVFVVD
jgi:hypothetical protein